MTLNRALGIIALCASCVSISFADFIANGDFGENADGFPNRWEISYRDEPDLGTVTFEMGDAPAGAEFVRLAPLNSRPPHYLALQQKLSEPPASGRYKLKAWMRVSEDYDAVKMPTVGLSWRLGDGAPEESTRPAGLSLDQNATPAEWVLCENEVEIPEGIETMYVFLCAYGSVGHADFDGVSLEPLQD